MRVVPLVGGESGHHEESEADEDVGCQHVASNGEHEIEVGNIFDVVIK